MESLARLLTPLLLSSLALAQEPTTEESERLVGGMRAGGDTTVHDTNINGVPSACDS